MFLTPCPPPTSANLQEIHTSEMSWTYKKLKANNKKDTEMVALSPGVGRKRRKRRGRYCVGDDRDNKLLINLPIS